MAKTLVAVETTASDPNLRLWVSVHPKRPDKGIDYFLLRSFEIKKELVNEFFSQADVLNSKSIKVSSLGEVEQVLTEWGVDSGSLNVPWKCNYPL
ncbi:MAG TPA: hypothetical protein VG733_08745 [Chthoniobacteraceae bacterium]|nr:hypothetical protein [Chthoniobacteraceae bacterium]